MGNGEKLYTIEDLENLLDNIPYEVWIKDNNGYYSYINKYGAEKMGVTKEDIIGRNDYEVRPRSMAEQCKYTDKQTRDKNKGMFHEERVSFDNREIWYEVYKVPIIKEEKVLLGGIGNEVSANRRFRLEFEKLMLDTFDKNNIGDNAILVYNNFLNKILKSIKEVSRCKSVNLFLYDKDSETFDYYLSANEGNDIFEINARINVNNEIIQKLKEDKLNKEVNELIKEEFSKFYKTSRAKKINSLYNIRPIKFADKLIGILYIYDEDIKLSKHIDEFFMKEICSVLSNVLTNIEISKGIEDFEQGLFKNDKEHFEQIVQLEVIKESFLASMSHEFRTPINIILATVQLLLSDLESNKELDRERFVKYLNGLKQNSYRLLRLANNILDTSKIYSGFYDLKKGNYNIVSVIEDIVLSTVDYIGENNKSIIFDTDEEEVILACDPDKIENIILNLISNSLKFTGDYGEISVNINVDKDKKKVYVHVKNNGPSIDEKDAKKIFGRFVQNEDLLTRCSEGSGIGLFLVKSLVEMHDGEIWVNTNEKNGAEFIFYLPIVKVKNEEYKSIKVSTISSKIEKCNIEFSDVYSL